MSLGGKIKDLRAERKMSMRGLARAVDVTPMHISNIEKGFTKGSSELISKPKKRNSCVKVPALIAS